MADKLKVIIVDDEARLRRGLARLVLACDTDWEVVGSFGSGKECLEVFQQTSLLFDLLITDVKMPGMDGLTLIKELKKETPCQAMVISGFADFQFLQTAIREGASDYMIKPIDRDEFKERLTSIKEKIRIQKEEKQYLERQACQLLHIKQIQKLNQFTGEQDTDLSRLDWIRSFPAGVYRLCYISIDNMLSKVRTFSKEDWNTWSFAVENIADEMIEKWEHNASIKAWKWQDKELSFWILLHKQSGELNQVTEQFSEEWKKNIRRFTPFTCSVAQSEDIQDLALLPNIKKELLTFMKFRLLYGGNQLFSKDIVEKWRQKHRSGNKNMENYVHKIIYAMNSGNLSKVRREADGFLKEMTNLESPEEIEQAIHFLAIRITSYMVENDQGKEELSLVHHALELTEKTANLTELRNEVNDWIKQVLYRWERKKEVENIDPVDTAKKWINDHLNQSLTIQKIADQIFMNPTYFCQMFKSHTGETVLDYVTRTRMEKARDLLLTADLKIYDIAEKVGYTDTKYFSKLFKNHFGEVPSRYKEKALLNDSVDIS